MKKTTTKRSQFTIFLTFALTLLIFLTKMSTGYADDVLPKTQYDIDYEKAEARMNSVCVTVNKVDFPKEDIPSETEKKKLKNCDSENFYYGIGVPINFVKARQCAFVEKDSGDGEIFGGSTMLMMLYANGKSVKQNFDLAIKLACKIEGAPAELNGRVNHLLDLKANPKNTTFDLCDDITSGFMQGACAGRENSIAEAKRQKQLDILTKQWPTQDQESFRVLTQVANNYFNTRTSNEVDLSGTARSMFEFEELESLQNDFFLAIEKFETSGVPFFSDEDDQQADIKLNKLYNSIMKGSDTQFEGTTVTKIGIKETQKAWLTYRDAWLAFTAIHYPQVSIASIRTWLTQQRIDQLDASAD